MSKITKLAKNPRLFFTDAYKKRIGSWFLTKSFIVIVALPFALAVVYYLFFAADRYVSTSIVSVRQAEQTQSASGGLAALAGINPSSKEDTLYLREYIRSVDMLNLLQSDINLRQIYSKNGADFIYGIYGFMSQEDFLEYYQSRVNMTYDDASGLLTINTEAFEAMDAKNLADKILVLSEKFVNELSHSVSRKQLEFAEIELKKSEARFSEAKNKLLEFQNKYGVFNPVEQAQSQANLALQFEGELSKKEAELAALSSYLQNSAPQILTLKSEIAALKEQIRKEQRRVAAKSNASTNLLASQYQTLSIEAAFAEELYKLSLQSVEQSRIESTKQIKYLSVIQTPSLPDSPKYPRKIYNLITLLAVLFLIYGISRLIKATIEDHKY